MTVPFSVFKRANTKGKVFYSARFQDENHKILKTVALKVTTKKDAILKAAELLNQGNIIVGISPDALFYVKGFWKRDSEYVVGRSLRADALSESYIRTSECNLRHFYSFLEGKKLLDLKPAQLERHIQDLIKKGVGLWTVNMGLVSLKTVMKYYCRMNRVPNPIELVENLKNRPKERGVLSLDELHEIFGLQDVSPRIRCAIALGALCGMRLGEVRGLLVEDIDFEAHVIHVQHNYVTKIEGVKKPKYNSTRFVPMTALVESLIKECLEKRTSEYVLYHSENPKNPIEIHPLVNGFYRCMKQIGITEDIRKKRNLVFHGLRHFYVSMSRASGLPDFVIQKLAGHKSAAMMERYSHASIIDFASARKRIESAYSDPSDVSQIREASEN